MKQVLYLFAAVLMTCCLEACQKAEKEVHAYNAMVIKAADDGESQVCPSGSEIEFYVDNAMVIKPADGGESQVCPLGSAFSMNSLYVDPTTGRTGGARRYCFFRDSNTQYPIGKNNSIVEVSGVEFHDTEYAESVDWISCVSVRGLDQSYPQALRHISFSHGKYNGENDLIKDARIDAFQDENIRIVIVTAEDEVIAIRYSGKVLDSELM